VCLCDATWNVIAWNGAWAALQCGQPASHAWEGNLAWRTFGNLPGRVSRTRERAASFEAMLAARLRTASLRYPGDGSLGALVDELRSASGTFDTLWRVAGAPAPVQADQAVLSHPDAGDVTLDCDLVAIPDGDLLAMVFTARLGSPDAALLGEIVSTGRPAVVSMGQLGPG
jgi:MmyB-like transcription regulator ligand binding domain